METPTPTNSFSVKSEQRAIGELEKLEEIITISDGDSILMAQKLVAKLGLGVEISRIINATKM